MRPFSLLINTLTPVYTELNDKQLTKSTYLMRITLPPQTSWKLKEAVSSYISIVAIICKAFSENTFKSFLLSIFVKIMLYYWIVSKWAYSIHYYYRGKATPPLPLGFDAYPLHMSKEVLGWSSGTQKIIRGEEGGASWTAQIGLQPCEYYVKFCNC